MRRSLITILCTMTLLASFAQNSKMKYGIGAGISLVDFSGAITDQYLMLDRHTGALNLSIGRYLSKSFDGRLNLSYGTIWHPFVTNYPNQIEGLYSQATMWDLGFNIMLKLNNGSLLKEDSRIAPYFFTGLGANMINGIGNVGVNDDINTYIPAGLGMNVRINDEWSVGLEGAYKFNLDNSYSYTQSTLKVIRNFGKSKEAKAAPTDAAAPVTASTDAPKVEKKAEAAVAPAAAVPPTPSISETFCQHRTSVYAGIGFVDFQTPITGQPFMFDRYKAVLNIGVQQYLNKFFDGRLNFVYGNVWHPFETAYPKVIEGNMVPATMFELGVDFMFKFNNGKLLKENSIFAPYIFTGLSVQSITGIGNVGVSDDINTNIPLGLGFNFRTSDRFTLGIEGAYKFNIDNSYDYVGAGLRGIYHLGKCIDGTKKEVVVAKAAVKVDDADGDGIADLTDECPFVAGKVEFFGCPDSDGDAIGDSRDKCPFEAGSVANQGCPGKGLETEVVNADDSDKDGINNNDDLCPDEAGPASNNGCPVPGENVSMEVKSSGDVKTTEVAKTPVVTTPATTTSSSTAAVTKAPAATSPAKSSTTVGAVTMGGGNTATTSTTTTSTTTTTTATPAKEREVLKYVPPVDNTNQNLVNSYTIFFSSGNNIASGQIETLQAIANLLRNNPNYSVRLNGHTAKGGGSERNMDLSISRAEKVLGTLRMKGVDMKRTRLVGYGDERTKYSGSENGKNNRVEVEVYSFE